jgi:hypothetical protein
VVSEKTLSFDEVLSGINSGKNGEDQAEDEVRKLPKEFVEMLKSLDRLLSIGSYYQSGHERYQEVAREAFAAVTSVMGPNKALYIEVAKEGFWIEDAFLEAEAREVHRLHEILEPLNIAEVEITKEVSAEDLHQAMTALKQQHNNLGAVDSYKEVTIHGLPDTFRTTDRSLYVRTRGRNRGPTGTRDLAEAMGDFREIPDAMLVDTPEGQSLEREFLNIVGTIMQTGDPTKLKDAESDEERDRIISEWIPDSKVKAIKAILRSLERTNSDPMMLESLIGHAQKALELIGDPLLVEMVFQRLRKEAADRASSSKLLLENRPKPRNPKKRPIKYTMTTEQMTEVIDGLAEIAEFPEDLVSPAAADTLGVCVQVLAVAPTEDLVVGVGQTIYQILSAADLADDTVSVLGDALAAVTLVREESAVDFAVPMFTVPLRRYHPELLGPTWNRAWEAMGNPEQQERAWPHVVNDILLGMKWEDPAQRFQLYEGITAFDIDPCPSLLDRLESLQAMREEHIERDIFHAPAPLLYPVHRVLLSCSMGREHGEGLQERLIHQRANHLADTMLMAMGDFKLGNKAIYNAILVQGMDKAPGKLITEAASRLLRSSIKRLAKEERQVPWLPDAIRWLGRLDLKNARKMLELIRDEKKFIFFPVWPAECREAAQDALDGVMMPVRQAPPMTDMEDDEVDAVDDVPVERPEPVFEDASPAAALASQRRINNAEDHDTTEEQE